MNSEIFSRCAIKVFTVFIAAGMLAGMEASAEIYKCTDPDAGVAYSDKPCKGESAIFVPRAGPKLDKNMQIRREQRKRLLRAYREENAAQQQQAAEQKIETEEREENCRRARINYQKFMEAGRVYRTGSDGRRVDFTDRERAEATALMQAEIERWCDRE